MTRIAGFHANTGERVIFQFWGEKHGSIQHSGFLNTAFEDDWLRLYERDVDRERPFSD